MLPLGLRAQRLDVGCEHNRVKTRRKRVVQALVQDIPVSRAAGGFRCQRYPAQHSTTQHSTVQHSTAQRSIWIIWQFHLNLYKLNQWERVKLQSRGEAGFRQREHSVRC